MPPAPARLRNTLRRLAGSPAQRGVALLLLVGTGCLVEGCETLAKKNVPGSEYYSSKVPEQREADAKRELWLAESDPEAFRWLLGHEVQNDMTVGEVSQALGTEGERLYNDTAMKTHSGDYLSTDEGYQWGPDNRGRSVVLFFRNNHLVGFNPADFGNTEPPPGKLLRAWKRFQSADEDNK